MPGGVEQRPRMSQEVKGSLELQNGGLRALEEAWMINFPGHLTSVRKGFRSLSRRRFGLFPDLRPVSE